MSIKIGILIDTLNGGGAERSAGLLSTILSNLGYQVFVIVLFDDIAYPYSGKLINLGLYKKGSRSLQSKFLRYIELKSKIKEHQFDLILDFRMKNFPIRELLLNRFVFKSKMINMIRSFKLNGYLPNPRFLSKYLYKNYAGVNTVSKAIQEEIEKIYNFKNVSTIHNPIDIGFISQKTLEALVIEDEYIVVLGRLNTVKQIDRLLDAYNDSILPKQNIKLYIIGDGSERNRIIKKIDDLGLESKIKLLPFQENPFKYLSQAKFLILSSKNEGFPRVLVEALACGTPVVSFDCKSGPNEIIQDNVNGLLVEDQNFKSLTAALNEMTSNTDLYQTCKKNSVESISKFSMKVIGEEWQNYIDNVLLGDKLTK